MNKRLKRWPGWVLLAFVVAGFLAVGAFRSSGPTTQGDRVDAIASRVACPICAGESVFVSQNSASRAIRNEITELVNDNDLSDADIIAFIETRYGAQVLLVPRSTGFDALIWVLPAVGLICGLAGLTVVFRRWKREAAATADPTDADRELVASALADDRARPAHAPTDHAPGKVATRDGAGGSRPARRTRGGAPVPVAFARPISNANTTPATSTTRTTPRCATATRSGPRRCCGRSTDSTPSLAPKPPRRWGRTVAIAAVVVAASVGIGFVLAAAWGERQTGQEITGFTPGDDARLLLANAREAMNGGDFALANSLFAQVVEMEREQGRDNGEAIAYFGWTLASAHGRRRRRRGGRRSGSTPPGSRSARRSSWSRSMPTRTASWRSSSSSSSRMPNAALPYVETCEASNPPSEVADLIEAFAADIRAAAG